MKKNKLVSSIASIVIVVGAILYLLLSGLDDSMIYYKTVDEILADTTRFDGQTVRVNGVLVSKSVKQKPGTDEYRFNLSKKGKILNVAYSGILPDSMRDGQELVVQGAMEAERSIFFATEILTKCPSKHEAKAKAVGP
jgi:cytochrome c-type biogenesis protein CcmE